MNDRKRRTGTLKDGTSRLAKAGGRRRVPPIIWLGAIVIVIGAWFLFRGSGGSAPTGIGERRSVVTIGADSNEAGSRDGAHAPPRSGEVDIDTETRELVPESPAGAAAATDPAPAPPEPAETTTRPTPSPAAETGAEAERVLPAASGGWVVQVGSFGSAENADGEAARLREKGWDARVKVGNRADGTMIYRVRIGYFGSREAARTFAAQNEDAVPGAIAVHR